MVPQPLALAAACFAAFAVRSPGSSTVRSLTNILSLSRLGSSSAAAQLRSSAATDPPARPPAAAQALSAATALSRGSKRETKQTSSG